MSLSPSEDNSEIRAGSATDLPVRDIGIVGLGHMGNAFAANLIADGYRVTVFDRDAKHADPLIAAGAAGASGLGSFANCEAVLTSLPHDNAVEDVTLSPGGLVHVLAKGAIHISMSTISPGLSRRMAQQHKAAARAMWPLPCSAIPI
jgi:3-hydroxyisobutyrate dehydrogenase-like beta-hydroxyacid dehydrogenase